MCHRSLFLNHWFDTTLGQHLLDTEAVAMQQILPSLFGYHLVQIGGMGQGRLLESSRIIHRCLLSRYFDLLHTDYSQICATPETLPFAQDSVDVMILPHVLEFEDNPHEVLREVARTLIPEGHVIILGFNPFSLWGMWRWFLAQQTEAPWCGRFIPLLRMKDWLALLGFELVEQRILFFAPPFRNERLMKRTVLFAWLVKRLVLNFGAVYLLVAKKRVVTLTPIRPKWQTRRILIAGAMTTRFEEHPTSCDQQLNLSNLQDSSDLQE